MISKNITLRCDCGCSVLVFTRYDYNNLDTSYDFSFEDSYINRSCYNGVFGRLKRAWKAFTGKPVVYANLFTDDEIKMRTFLNDCLSLMPREDTTSAE